VPADPPHNAHDSFASQQRCHATGKPVSVETLIPFQVPAKVACRLAGLSLATWWRLHAQKKVPTPNRLNGRPFWRVEELRAWVAAGCPDNRTWQAMTETEQK
jgi:hypothetical protein